MAAWAPEWDAGGWPLGYLGPSAGMWRGRPARILERCNPNDSQLNGMWRVLIPQMGHDLNLPLQDPLITPAGDARVVDVWVNACWFVSPRQFCNLWPERALRLRNVGSPSRASQSTELGAPAAHVDPAAELQAQSATAPAGVVNSCRSCSTLGLGISALTQRREEYVKSRGLQKDVRQALRALPAARVWNLLDYMVQAGASIRSPLSYFRRALLQSQQQMPWAPQTPGGARSMNIDGACWHRYKVRKGNGKRERERERWREGGGAGRERERDRGERGRER